MVSAIVKSTSIDELEYRNMEYLFADISHLNEGQDQMDGLLGFPFLSKEKISINFKTNKICIWDEFPEFRQTYATSMKKR